MQLQCVFRTPQTVINQFVTRGVLCFFLAAAPSRHFGCAGELWNPAGRLPADWSFAGYKNGDEPIPTVPVVASVKDYGAKGDNITDDTAAFLAAISDPKVGRTSLMPEAAASLPLGQ
jgi:hypothetical protein